MSLIGMESALLSSLFFKHHVQYRMFRYTYFQTNINQIHFEAGREKKLGMLWHVVHLTGSLHSLMWDGKEVLTIQRCGEIL